MSETVILAANDVDTREKLEEDMFRAIKSAVEHGVVRGYGSIGGWLDRQAAITERELCQQCDWPSLAAMPDLEQQERIAEQDRRIVEYAEQVDKLTEERDELRERVRKLTMKTMRVEDERKRDSERWARIAHQHQEDLHEIMELRDELREKQHVCDVQRESFRKMEAELAAARHAALGLWRRMDALRLAGRAPSLGDVAEMAAMLSQHGIEAS